MAWLEITVPASAEAVDWIYTLLGTAGQIEVALMAVGAGDAEWPHTLRIYTAQARQLGQLETLLEPLERTGQIGALEVAEVAALPADAGQAQRLGERFVLLPPGAPEQPALLPVRLAPSRAFGSGLHPATRLCVALLERHVTPGIHALDLGCGSGVLSVVLARLGASVVAADNDPLAVEAAHTTVEENMLSDQIAVVQGSLGASQGLGHWMQPGALDDVQEIGQEAGFELIVANILARIHSALAPDYRRTLRPGGLLITAGYTEEYEEHLAEIFAENGLEQVEVLRDGAWVAMACRRGANVHE